MERPRNMLHIYWRAPIARLVALPIGIYILSGSLPWTIQHRTNPSLGWYVAAAVSAILLGVVTAFVVSTVRDAPRVLAHWRLNRLVSRTLSDQLKMVLFSKQGYFILQSDLLSLTVFRVEYEIADLVATGKWTGGLEVPARRYDLGGMPTLGWVMSRPAAIPVVSLLQSDGNRIPLDDPQDQPRPTTQIGADTHWELISTPTAELRNLLAEIQHAKLITQG